MLLEVQFEPDSPEVKFLIPDFEEIRKTEA